MHLVVAIEYAMNFVHFEMLQLRECMHDGFVGYMSGSKDSEVSASTVIIIYHNYHNNN